MVKVEGLLPQLPKMGSSAGLHLASFLVDRHADELAGRRRPFLRRRGQAEVVEMRLMATSSMM